MYNVKNWYWVVDGSTTQIYSSAAATYISISDNAYTAWRAAGNTPTTIIGNDMLLIRIDLLESSITERMKQEAISGSANTFPAGPYAGKTSAQAITLIVADKDALRAQLT